MSARVLLLFLAFGLDCILGDPDTAWHPVRAIGWLISFFEKKLRRLFPATAKGMFTGGMVTTICVVSITGTCAYVLCALADWIHPLFGFAARVILAYQCLSPRCLRDESMNVYKKLTTSSLPDAREAVARIVGRDTAALDKAGITKATVETVAENTTDGVIAPMLFLLFGGITGGFVYKAINTLDSMIGYKNEKYRYFGTFAAKLDDIANFIPARISAFLLIAAAFVLRLDGKNAVKIFCRDRYNHASPNSAQTEAVVAGALHIALAGDAYYFGELYQKPQIGDDDRAILPKDIPLTNRMMYVATGLFLLGNLLCVFLIAR